MNVLVIDVGTSSMRAMLYTQDGERLITSQKTYRPDYLDGGRVEQDAGSFIEALYSVVGEARAEAVERGLAVDAASMTSQRSSIAAIDANGKALTPFIMWQDTRNSDVCERLAEHNDLIFQVSGTRVNTVFSGSKMAWIEKNLENVASAAARYSTIPELLLHEMTGEWKIDATYASRSNLMDIRGQEWSEELLELFGVPAEKLGRIVAPGSCVGYVTEAFSQATGLAAGTPVVSAGGDQQCAAAGQGVVVPGAVSVVAGTGAFLQTAVREVPEDLESDVICNASSLPGLYTLEASVPACCSAFDWYRKQFCPDMGFDEIARVLEVEHAKCDPSVVLPHFQGRGTPDWNSRARGAFVGIDLSATRESLLYALIVGIFTEVRVNMDSMERYVPLVGGNISGGLTQTPAVNQIQADVYGFAVEHQDDFESTARGALIAALVGQGVYADAKTAYEAVTAGIGSVVYEPNAERHAKLADVAARAAAAYNALNGR